MCQDHRKLEKIIESQPVLSRVSFLLGLDKVSTDKRPALNLVMAPKKKPFLLRMSYEKTNQLIDLFGRGTMRAEDAQETPTQSRISPSILVHENESMILGGTHQIAKSRFSEEIPQGKKMSKCHLPRVVYQQVYKVYENQMLITTTKINEPICETNGVAVTLQGYLAHKRQRKGVDLTWPGQSRPLRRTRLRERPLTPAAFCVGVRNSGGHG